MPYPISSRSPRARRRHRSTAIVGLLLAALLASLLAAVPAAAYKPYTHNWTAETAYDDAVDDCQVTINGAEYPVIPEVCAAIGEYPAYYNAGVIGPDGFPDLAFGQAVIHPEYTGKWMRHLYDAAWSRWNATGATDENQQILAFTYGFLTHGAGDLWAHTLVNEFADGVFPGVFDMIEEVEAGEVEADNERQLTEIALRHIIVEGYIGDATPGYDGNDDRTLVPGEVNEDGDPEVSDDATPGTDFAMPTAFLYDLLINPANPLPVGRCGDGVDDDADGTPDDGCPGGPFTVGDDPEPKRGPLIDHFLDLQADLQVKQAEFAADKLHTECFNGVDPDCYAVGESDAEGTGFPIIVNVQTVRGNKQTTLNVNQCIGAEFFCVADPVDLADDAFINGMAGDYLDAWIDDIETGLHEWPRLGLELTNLLFDARTYREAQDSVCDNGGTDDNEHEGNDGDLTSGYRANCEDGVGFGDVLLYAIGGFGNPSDTYLTDHLLSMLGAPDFVGAGFELAADVLSFLLDILQTVIPNFDALSDLFDAIKDLLLEGLSSALGFDVEVLFNFLKHPTYWMDQSSLSITLPFGTTASADLFPATAREKLDELMGLGPDPLVEDNEVELPNGDVIQATKLKDDAEWDVEDFDVAFNAIQLSKMVLVDGDALNGIIKDQLTGSTVVKPTATIATYADGAGSPANVMIDPLSGDDPWLVSIDADHGWRQDAQPINVIRDPGVLHGGNGKFPLWESCIARPAFRSLFRDWEPDTAGPGGIDANFGDLGDATSYDPTSTPASTSIAYGGSQAVVGGVQYLGIDHTITVSAVDPVFTDGNVAIHYRAYPAGEDAGDWSTELDGSVTFSLDPAYTDGPHVIEYQATNPCTTVAASGTTANVVLDETPPTVTVTAPADGAVFDVNTISPVSATHTDAGAGVDLSTVVYSFDGSAITVPHTLDTFFLAAGFHTVSSAATDKVGNTGSDTNTFEVRPTSAGMLSVLDRARSLNLITKNDVLRALKDTLTIAARSHQKGKHPTEWNALDAALSQLASQRGKGIDVTFADRMSGWIRWLLAYEMP